MNQWNNSIPKTKPQPVRTIAEFFAENGIPIKKRGEMSSKVKLPDPLFNIRLRGSPKNHYSKKSLNEWFSKVKSMEQLK